MEEKPPPVRDIDRVLAVSKSFAPVDLSTLEGLKIGPTWSDTSCSSSTSKKNKNADDKLALRSGNRPVNQRDRRIRQGSYRGRKENRYENAHLDKSALEVSFYPEDAPFKALIRAVRSSYRTYELFEIAQLILQKPERFVVVVRIKLKSDGQLGQFYISVPDGLPFESDAESINHVFKNHSARLFEVETIEVEPPKGSFQAVNRCSITGELLGPPNYHRYPQLEQEHHINLLLHIPFETFRSKIETIRSPEVLQEWLKKMTRQTHYTFKLPREGKAPTFENAEAARHYLLTHHKDQVVRTSTSVRFSGKALKDLPGSSRIRRAVEAALEAQQRFPLETANHLRGRLRRLNFAVYKKGAKGISYISAVKRKFRESGQVFAESGQTLIEFIERHPFIHVSQLPKKFLGIELNPPVAKKPQQEEAPPSAQGEEVSSVPNETLDHKSLLETVEAKDSEVVKAERHSGEAREAMKKTEADSCKGRAAFNPEAESNLGQLSQDLRWLITEGYVIEYSDGRLFASAPRQRPKPVPPKESSSKTPEPEATTPDAAEGDKEEKAAELSK